MSKTKIHSSFFNLKRIVRPLSVFLSVCARLLQCVRESQTAERTGGSVARVYSVNRRCIGNTAAVKRQQKLCGNFKHGGFVVSVVERFLLFTLLSSDELKQQARGVNYHRLLLLL